MKSNSIKVEEWNGYKIRFVEVNTGDWWAVAKDIADALEYSDAEAMTRRVKSSYICTYNLSVQGQKRKSILLSEFGIYKAIFNSHKPDAEDFQEWIFTTIKKLREAAGLEGYQVFKLTDPKIQKQIIAGLDASDASDFIKANVIANKTLSNKYGYKKMLKKSQMTPQMLMERPKILKAVVELMNTVKKFGLDVSVSKTIYKKFN